MSQKKKETDKIKYKELLKQQETDRQTIEKVESMCNSVENKNAQLRKLYGTYTQMREIYLSKVKKSEIPADRIKNLIYFETYERLQIDTLALITDYANAKAREKERKKLESLFTKEELEEMKKEIEPKENIPEIVLSYLNSRENAFESQKESKILSYFLMRNFTTIIGSFLLPKSEIKIEMQKDNVHIPSLKIIVFGKEYVIYLKAKNTLQMKSLEEGIIFSISRKEDQMTDFIISKTEEGKIVEDLVVGTKEQEYYSYHKTLDLDKEIFSSTWKAVDSRRKKDSKRFEVKKTIEMGQENSPSILQSIRNIYPTYITLEDLSIKNDINYLEEIFTQIEELERRTRKDCKPLIKYRHP